ncbi:hypothetical protein QBC34DRAFT_402054 [Podospora aff. communis PSN243]|uniref:Azaphilone pigments biosynthesis cluster protein L N-terminal domain-containing protein n=1 Tax=Podospora aff. communis PSN243 TaxID=3040156 RepID=A0AAV9GSS2_9PEZI|nr:hypothetical protein QBC34DRAFT_402054 [Podospora aff. communis PSN243]
MDPLSIIGSVAGVATAGVSLVSVLFETVETYRNAPKEIGTIARGIQDLSLVLDQLVQVLSDGSDMHTRRLRKSVLATVKRIDDVHDEVWDLVERGDSSFGRVKWTLFLKGKMRDLVARIEAHKSTVQLVCTTLLLAMQQRHVAKSKEPEVAVFARRPLRRQAENLVNAAHQSLRDLTERGHSGDETGHRGHESRNASENDPTPPSATTSTHDPEKPEPGPEPDQALRIRSQAEDTAHAALFLYNMVFSRTGTRDGPPSHGADTMPDDSNALVIRDPSGTDIVLAGRPFAAQVVDSLLQEWTILSDAEIDEVAEMNPGEERQTSPARRPSHEHDRERGRRPKESHDHKPWPRSSSPRHRNTQGSEEDPVSVDTRPPKAGYRPMIREFQGDEPPAKVASTRTAGLWEDIKARTDPSATSSRTAGLAEEVQARLDEMMNKGGSWHKMRPKGTPVTNWGGEFHFSNNHSRSGLSMDFERPRSREGPRVPNFEKYVRTWPSARRTHVSKTARVQRDAMACLIKGANEAFRPIRKEVKGRHGVKTKWVANAANVGISGQTS